jgi:ADP-heptose:LPS heptosyltransferase
MKNILIIKLGALGDVVMSTSLIRQIILHHKNDSVWLITSSVFADIFRNYENLKVRTLDRKSLLDNFRTVFWIRKAGFSRLYDLQSSDRTSVICALSGAGEIIGNHPRFPYTIYPESRYTGQCHIYDRLLQVLSAAGISAVPEPPWLPATEPEKQHVLTWLKQHHLQPGKFAVLHAGASITHPEKCWPYFGSLAEAISKSGYKTVWAGSEADRAINKTLAGYAGVDASGVFTVNELAELGRQAAFAVTNDSGPMHILSASGIPVFAFFGPTNWRRNHAIGQADNVICEDGNAVEFTPVPLDRISVDLAITRIRKKLYPEPCFTSS